MHTCIYLAISVLCDNDATQDKVLDKSAKMIPALTLYYKEIKSCETYNLGHERTEDCQLRHMEIIIIKVNSFLAKFTS